MPLNQLAHRLQRLAGMKGTRLTSVIWRIGMNTPMKVLGLVAVGWSLLLATSTSTLAIGSVPHAPIAVPAPSGEEKPSMAISDVKALTKGGIGDDVIISQIRTKEIRPQDTSSQ